MGKQVCIPGRKKHKLDAHGLRCTLCGWNWKKKEATPLLRVYEKALKRIRDMAVRPECVCGRPTGTDAIRMCAETALKSQHDGKLTDENR